MNRPNRVGDPFKSGHVAANSTCVAPAGPVHTAAQWFNPCAFETAAPDTYGDAGRNSLLGPDFSSFDISLLRRFTLPERATLTFEVESFNLFNKPNFDLPQAFTDLPTPVRFHQRTRGARTHASCSLPHGCRSEG